MTEALETRALDGTLLFARMGGPAEGPPVVLLHSIGCDGVMWDAQVEALRATRRVVCPDARGHGRSGAPSGDYGLEQLGRDLIALLDALDIARADICGLSLGGLTAQWLAVHAPDRVRRLVLANTAPRIGTAEAWQARADLVRAEGLAAIAELALGRFFSDDFRGRQPAAADAARRTLLATSPEGYAGCCAALRDADLTADLRRITAPALVIAGARDVSTPPAGVRAMAEALQHADYEELDAAHLSNLERPAEFAAALMRHLEAD